MCQSYAPDVLPPLFMSTYNLQAFGQHMMKQLQDFAALSQMKRLALLLLARTFTDKDVMRLKVQPQPPLPPLPSALVLFLGEFFSTCRAHNFCM